MLRTVLATIAPRATAASRSRAASGPGRCAPFTAFATRRPSPSPSRFSPSPQGGQSLPLDCAAAVTIRSVPRRCSWREMSSASAHVAAPGGGDLAMQGEGGGEGQQGEMGSSGRYARDPVTGEGIWVDEEDEPLDLEKPKKVQKFCGKVISDNMDKTIKVAVPYWYYVRRLGKRIIRYSKMMAHDEENSANVGDTVILVDCQQKSKRKKHTLLKIVRKLPRLDDI
ncbi:ribosomal protein S17 [Ectocarpus siliculosus]|uniref:Ribosomal protein S17 n=1 Tax=Ectocarpus siliculosus TaxID=2880 RepID=D7FZ53_ECTSI|nr:ribosomal protein S17 [Ectocarpus siliculosus]|eukprot:CBJ32670.1 ribosomal protein S17 [Ectocarpus siliculosus]